MHRALMGDKEGCKTVGELWRDVFCLMVWPPKKTLSASTGLSYQLNEVLLRLTKCFFPLDLTLHFFPEEQARDKSPRTDTFEDSIIVWSRQNCRYWKEFLPLTGCVESLSYARTCVVFFGTPTSLLSKHWEGELRWEHFNYVFKIHKCEYAFIELFVVS